MRTERRRRGAWNQGPVSRIDRICLFPHAVPGATNMPADMTTGHALKVHNRTSSHPSRDGQSTLSARDLARTLEAAI